jgi:hypothetical protein
VVGGSADRENELTVIVVVGNGFARGFIVGPRPQGTDLVISSRFIIAECDAWLGQNKYILSRDAATYGVSALAASSLRQFDVQLCDCLAPRPIDVRASVEVPLKALGKAPKDWGCKSREELEPVTVDSMKAIEMPGLTDEIEKLTAHRFQAVSFLAGEAVPPQVEDRFREGPGATLSVQWKEPPPPLSSEILARLTAGFIAKKKCKDLAQELGLTFATVKGQKTKWRMFGEQKAPTYEGAQILGVPPARNGRGIAVFTGPSARFLHFISLRYIARFPALLGPLRVFGRAFRKPVIVARSKHGENVVLVLDCFPGGSFSKVAIMPKYLTRWISSSGFGATSGPRKASRCQTRSRRRGCSGRCLRGRRSRLCETGPIRSSPIATPSCSPAMDFAAPCWWSTASLAASRL